MSIRFKSKHLNYLISIFFCAPKEIIKLWICDLIDLFYDAFEPWLIGLAIDGLILHDYTFFVFFMVLLFVDVIINYYNNKKDNRLYNEIKTNYKMQYYCEAMKNNIEITEIDSNIELVDTPIEFIRSIVVNYGDLFIKFVVSALFIFNNLSYLIGIVAIFVSVISLMISLKFNNKKLIAQDKIYAKNEKRRENIGKGSKAYKKFLKYIYKLDIISSDIEAKSNWFINIFKMILLGTSLIIFIQDNNITAGLIFSGIEYIMILSDVFDTVPDLCYEYGDVCNCVERINVNRKSTPQ